MVSVAATPATSAPVPPRAIGSGEAQTRAALASTPLRFRPDPARLAAPLSELPGIGPKLAAAAQRLGLETAGDLLWHLPHGYRDRSNVREIADLRIGEEATVAVVVREAKVRPTRRRGLRIVEVAVADRSGTMKAIWFNQVWLVDRLQPGAQVLLSGSRGHAGFKVSAHEILGQGAGIHTLGIVPTHSTTDGLSADRVREWAWALRDRARDVPECLPAELRARRRLPHVADALCASHFPASAEAAELARKRLAIEELILHQLALAARRQQRGDERPGVEMSAPGELVERWLASLPFVLTGGQLAALAELDQDLSGARPMQRLLMGEVGTGKTVVALYAMLRAVESGRQAVLMAPTETLAEQHAQTLDQLLAGEPVPFTLLTGSTPAAARRQTLERLATGELAMVVGTHALVEQDVVFRDLAVSVVDEQHRFGVRQRAALDSKGPVIAGAGGQSERAVPHVLHMTATPIPRTLSMTAYGDLDTTVLRELPAGRQPVKTWVVGEERRAGAYGFVRKRLREGRQAFFVCPLVVDSDKLEAKAASDEAERLAAGEFKDFDVALLHGQMHPRDKAAAMERFSSGAANVLVATSVIEVGIDVPNASVMVIEGAERFGLSQLHQLRGRVGRGAHESYCILFAEPESYTARKRLKAIESEADGFRLAEVDLELRGEGELLGTRQSGLPRFRAAVLPDDTALLVEARREAQRILAAAGSLDDLELAPMLDAARRRFGDERERGIAA